jgi:hypothetical protein
MIRNEKGRLRVNTAGRRVTDGGITQNATVMIRMTGGLLPAGRFTVEAAEASRAESILPVSSNVDLRCWKKEKRGKDVSNKGEYRRATRRDAVKRFIRYIGKHRRFPHKDPLKKHRSIRRQAFW